MEALVYLNGDLLPFSQAKIGAFDYGFLYGFGLFETMRAYSGRVFRLDRHLERLLNSAQLIGIPVNYRKSELEKAIYATIRANQLTDCRVRLTVSAGEGAMVPDPGSCKSPTVLVAAQPISGGVTHNYTVTITSYRRNSQSPLCRVKATNYLENILARDSSRRKGCDEALFLNEKGLVAEGSMTNVFLVTGARLVTPDENSGILPGITRGVVLEIARKLDIESIERPVSLDELFKAAEAFLTNSVIGVAPLIKIDNVSIRAGKAGPVTNAIAGEYEGTVTRETRP